MARVIIQFWVVIAMLVSWSSCKTPKYTCPAYSEHKHRALADSSDPSNSIKMYSYYPVLEEGGGDSTLSTSATSIEGIEDDSKTNEEILHENDLAKEKEEESASSLFQKPMAHSNDILRKAMSSLSISLRI